MKSNLIGLIVLKSVCIAILCVYSDVSGQARDRTMMNGLEARLDSYKAAFRSEDYVTVASFMPPLLIKKIGGAENYAKLAHEIMEPTMITLEPSRITFSKPAGIVIHNNVFISVVRKIIPVTTRGMSDKQQGAFRQFNPGFPPALFRGMDGVLKIAIVAYSDDYGDSWLFTGGNKTGLEIAGISPGILGEIDISVPTMVFSDGDSKITLVRENRKWVVKGSETSDGLAYERLILVIAGQMFSPLLNDKKIDRSYDCLDAYIYLEEQPPESTEAKKAVNKKINVVQDEDKGGQNPSVEGSDSVYVTSGSRIYHRSGCPELADSVVLRFDSAKTALESGGIPCEHCKPRYSMITGK